MAQPGGRLRGGRTSSRRRRRALCPHSPQRAGGELMANPDWATQPPPSLADFETFAEAAYARLPEDFRALCQGIVIQVDDFPTDDVLDQMGCETEFDLLGLFTGRGLAQGGAQA